MDQARSLNLDHLNKLYGGVGRLNSLVLRWNIPMGDEVEVSLHFHFLCFSSEGPFRTMPSEGIEPSPTVLETAALPLS
jgi:hypothetical protein